MTREELKDLRAIVMLDRRIRKQPDYKETKKDVELLNRWTGKIPLPALLDYIDLLEDRLKQAEKSVLDASRLAVDSVSKANPQ